MAIADAPAAAIVDWTTNLELGHPTRFGLDGRSAAGKTTLADALAEMTRAAQSRPVLRASIDDFPRPGHKFRAMADSRTLVGGCETRLRPDGSAEVSWWVFPEHRRQGLATRGVRLMIDHFSNTVGISMFVAMIEPDNLASRHVARNTGFIESGLDTSGSRPMLRHERR